MSKKNICFYFIFIFLFLVDGEDTEKDGVLAPKGASNNESAYGPNLLLLPPKICCTHVSRVS
jgi:hypothetical protein